MILIVSQIIGVAAVVLYLISFQLKRRRHIVWVTCLSNVLYVLQYLLLGAFSGAVLDVLSAASSFFAAQKHAPLFRRHARWVMLLLLWLIVVAGVTSAALQRDPIELLPIAGALLQTGALWFDDEQTIRKLALAGAPFWLGYNYISQAYGAALGAALTMVSTVVAMVRYWKKKKEE